MGTELGGALQYSLLFYSLQALYSIFEVGSSCTSAFRFCWICPWDSPRKLCFMVDWAFNVVCSLFWLRCAEAANVHVYSRFSLQLSRPTRLLGSGKTTWPVPPPCNPLHFGSPFWTRCSGIPRNPVTRHRSRNQLDWREGMYGGTFGTEILLVLGHLAESVALEHTEVERGGGLDVAFSCYLELTWSTSSFGSPNPPSVRASQRVLWWPWSSQTQWQWMVVTTVHFCMKV